MVLGARGDLETRSTRRSARGCGGYPAQGGLASSMETRTKLYISNLDYGVSNDDIKVMVSVLFVHGLSVLGLARTRNFVALAIC